MNLYDYDAIFELLLKNSSTCSLLMDLEGNIIRFNLAYMKLIGYTEEEIKSIANKLYTPEADYNRETSYIQKLLKGNKSDIKFGSSRITKNGKVILVEVTAILFKDENGKAIFVLKRIEDVSERVLSDEVSRSRLALLETILEEFPINMYFKDLDSRFLMVSKKFVSFFGCNSFDEIEGKTDFDFFKEEHAREAYNDEQQIIKTGKSIEKEEREVHRDNSVTWALTTKSPLKDENGKIIGTYGISNDITAIKVAEEKKRQMNDELAQKNNTLEETIEELSRTQNKLIFAEKMAALGSLIGGIAHEINTPLGAIKASSTNISEVVEKINTDLPWLIDHASPDEISWLFTLLCEADSRDISVFSREERQRKRELSLLFDEEKIDNGAMIADTIVSLRLNHDNESYLKFLRLPNAQRLLQILKVLFSLKRNANNIFVSVDKAAKVVRALKSYIYKNDAGEYEATNIVETINTVMILTANMVKYAKTDIIPSFKAVPLVYCKQDEICQVWTNIITNAIQAMGESGTLEIGVELVRDDTILVWFKDNGPGIPDAVKTRIFEPYFTTKEKGVGTGMGLDISRQIVENHNGRIYFESEVGVGTTFFIEIPINQEK
jgi:PAS domain S-box-containing protein